jgi:hypothetical protein
MHVAKVKITTVVETITPQYNDNSLLTNTADVLRWDHKIFILCSELVLLVLANFVMI